LFDTVEGNIRFRAKKHDFVNGRCKWCGASAAQFDRDDGLESHAYEFIHTDKPEEIFNMKFDVIVGNPPYQMSTGGSKAQAVPIYNKFVEQAKKLYPNYIMMIIPDRWFAGGFGLNDFRVGMLKDKRISNIVDYPVASECFPGVDIPGGVCYFLWDRKYNDDCVVTVIVNGNSSTMKRPLLEEGCDVFIRYNESVDILKKIIRLKSDKFINLITSQKPFGLPTTFCGEKKSSHENTISVIGRNKERSYCSKKDVLSNKELINKYKVFVSAAYGERITENYFVIGNPFVGFPGEVCSETYIGIGPFKNEKECKNVCSYMRTKFFRFLVLLHKPTQHILRGVYSFVPMQDFSKPWVDEELYKKYNLTADEIKFIESMIKPME
jgi:site-specific DNA-methyltransferase (adenine-specific)